MLKIKVSIINDYMKENNLSKSEFCKKCKISFATLKKIMGGDETLTLPTQMKVARVVGKDLDVIFG